MTVLEERATDTVSDTEGASTTERERGCVCVRERESFKGGEVTLLNTLKTLAGH